MYSDVAAMQKMHVKSSLLLKHHKGEECDLSYFDRGMVVGGRWVYFKISLYFHTQQCLTVLTEWRETQKTSSK